jgi:WD40-like Beta Propeller Repeat
VARTIGSKAGVAACCLLLVAPVLALAPSAHATVPGANGLVAFVSGGPSGTTDIWTMHPDGTARTPLIATADTDVSPAWSPDGTELAFVRFAAGQTNPEIWVANADGSHQHQLTTGSNNIDEEPAWSPDGQHIVFASNRGNPSGPDDLYVMLADGTNVTPLTTNSAADRMPDWSPDGTKIAFVSTRAAGFSDIWVMDADGTNLHNLTNSTQAANLEPAWWPDSSKIVYASDPLTVTSSYDLYTVPVGGGSPTPLFTTPANEFNPSPSPDGARIFFDTNGALPASAGDAEPAGAGGTDVISCNVPVTACTSAGDGLDPSAQVASDSTCPQIEIKPLTLLDGVVGQRYGFVEGGEILGAVGGTRPYTFSIADPSTLPPGLTLNPNPGVTTVIHGTPTATGTYTFVFQVEDSTPPPVGPCRASHQYTIVVHCAGPTIAEHELLPATVGQDTRQINQASGGTPPYTWSIEPLEGGKLGGLGIDPASGDVIGVPRKEGSRIVRITVTDANGCVDFLDGIIWVAPRVDVKKLRRETLASDFLLIALEGNLNKQPDAVAAASASHDLRYRAAPIGGEFGGFHSLFKGSRDAKVTVRVTKGFEICFSAELHKAKGDGWGAETCFKAR